jgi:phosphoribosylamine--glycine ligase
MKILIIGSGGREHALAWKVAQSAHVERVYIAPGNAGTDREPKMENIQISADDIPALTTFAADSDIHLTIVGPEAPLVAGIVDRFREAGLRCFGPCQAAARLEGSKAFTKDFLARHSIPTADYATFDRTDDAITYIRQHGTPLVIKADGLAAGKGVVVALHEDDAVNAVQDMLTDKRYGIAGQRVVIEEFLVGEEASFIVMVDGEHILPLATSQDHKARDDGDTGPNTGGMGAYSPAPVITPELHDIIMHDIISPTVAGMARDGHPYTGFLYAGLMITSNGKPKVLEYNCRFGDPETQPIMMRLNTDLIALCDAALDRRLDQINIDWDPRVALGVVLAAGGYPGSYHKGDIIHGLPTVEHEGIKIFHAGTRKQDDHIVTAGGRVLCVCALGESVSEAQRRAYKQIKQIHWDNIYYRSDIGYRAISREQPPVAHSG